MQNQSHRQKRSTVTQLHVTDPKRELAESLPLCLGNEDYLKDFQPLSSKQSETIYEYYFPMWFQRVIKKRKKITLIALWIAEDADNEISKESSKSEEGSKIKVVHFGLL